MKRLSFVLVVALALVLFQVVQSTTGNVVSSAADVVNNDPPTDSRDMVSRFTQAHDWASNHGFAGGLTTLQQADYHDGRGMVRGVIAIPKGVGEWRDISSWDLHAIDNDLSHMDRRLAAANQYAVHNGFAAAFPTGHQALYDSWNGTVYGTVLIKNQPGVSIDESKIDCQRVTCDDFGSVYRAVNDAAYVTHHTIGYMTGRETRSPEFTTIPGRPTGPYCPPNTNQTAAGRCIDNNNEEVSPNCALNQVRYGSCYTNDTRILAYRYFETVLLSPTLAEFHDVAASELANPSSASTPTPTPTPLSAQQCADLQGHITNLNARLTQLRSQYGDLNCGEPHQVPQCLTLANQLADTSRQIHDLCDQARAGSCQVTGCP